MRLITLNYDDTTGALTDSSGAIITTWMGLQSVKSDSLHKIAIKLKEVGFSADEILEFFKAGMI